MAELSTLARPYARAAFEYARERNELTQWAEQLATAAAVTGEDRMQQLLGAPQLTAMQQADALTGVCGDSLGAAVRNFISVLSRNRRLALLPQIHVLFEEYKAAAEKSVDVEVVSAYELSDAARDRLMDTLGKKLQRQVVVRTSTDRGLLGGVLIRAGDLVIDGSVRGKLDKLAEALNS